MKTETIEVSDSDLVIWDFAIIMCEAGIDESVKAKDGCVLQKLKRVVQVRVFGRKYQGMPDCDLWMDMEDGSFVKIEFL